MPRLIRFYIRNVLIGFGLSGVFVALLLGLNAANLRSLVLGSDMAVVALLMLFIFNGIVFAGVQFGIAVMRLGSDDEGGGRRPPVGLQRPARVRAKVAGPPDNR